MTQGRESSSYNVQQQAAYPLGTWTTMGGPPRRAPVPPGARELGYAATNCHLSLAEGCSTNDDSPALLAVPPWAKLP